MLTVPDVSIPRLYERDIDVLVQEELLFSDRVRRLFCSALKLPSSMEIGQCALSVSDATGETDIEVHFVANEKQGALLIENKIDAAFQPRQPERYRERALALSKKLQGEVYCVLIAPANYNGGSEATSSFDAIISYEELAVAIDAEDTKRAEHRAKLVRHAIDLARKSYQLVPSEEVTTLIVAAANTLKTATPIV
jgi:hypothetical protein